MAKDALADLGHDPRIILVYNDQTRSAASTRNKAAQKATGDVVLFLDDDDQIDPTYPDRVRELAAHPSIAWGFARFSVAHETGIPRLRVFPGRVGRPARTCRFAV